GVPMSQHIRTAMTLCSIAFCVAIVNNASSQVNTADILGTVSDPGGAVIPGVKITVTNTATNESKTAITTSSGDYVVNLLPSGQYTVTAEAPAFKRATANVSVSAGDRARTDIKL